MPLPLKSTKNLSKVVLSHSFPVVVSNQTQGEFLWRIFILSTIGLLAQSEDANPGRGRGDADRRKTCGGVTGDE